MGKKDAEYELRENKKNWTEFDKIRCNRQTAPCFGYGAVLIEDIRAIITDNSIIFRL